jgi:hypothetical protein
MNIVWKFWFISWSETKLHYRGIFVEITFLSFLPFVVNGNKEIDKITWPIHKNLAIGFNGIRCKSKARWHKVKMPQCKMA